MKLRNMVVATGLGLLLIGSLIGTLAQDRKADRAPLLSEKEAKPQDRSRDLLPGQEPRAPWEYKFRRFDDPKEDIEKAFNELGRDGWEFVTVLEHGPVDQFGNEPRFIVFKRPGKK